MKHCSKSLGWNNKLIASKYDFLSESTWYEIAFQPNPNRLKIVQTASKHVLWLISAQKGRRKLFDLSIPWAEINLWSLTIPHYYSENGNFEEFFFKIQVEAIVSENFISAHPKGPKIIILGL